MIACYNMRMTFSPSDKGFTLVELMVSISIFIFMTALLVAKYGNFNQSVLLTNLAYDIALTIRTAQTYGLSVQGQQVGGFQSAYGVAFCKSGCSGLPNEKSIVLFADKNNNGIYDGVSTDAEINQYSIKRGAKIKSLCVVEGCSSFNDRLDISFLRPDPNAKICAGGSCTNAYAKIFLEAADGSVRTVVVRSVGQVSVEN